MQQYIFRKLGNDEAALVRVLGTSPETAVPGTIGGRTVTVIGSHCFADNVKIPEGSLIADDLSEGRPLMPDWDTSLPPSWRELSGDFIEHATLPDTVRQIENAAFFGCRMLRRLELGNGSLTIGSDVFSNCTSFHLTAVRGRMCEQSGIRQILDRVSWDMEIRFLDGSLYYPEYYESYDTIAPAHIFGLNIEGEGFRARQCFRGDVVDFAAYDDIFEKACAEESAETLGNISLNRLMAPTGLTPEKQLAYETYLKSHATETLAWLIKKKQLEKLAFFFERAYGGRGELESGIRLAAGMGWGEGTASLTEWKRRWFLSEKRSRYEF